MSIATQSAAALAAANSAANVLVGGQASAPIVNKAATARANLSGNFDDFLKLLMTQLKNQDPSNPLDTNQFTSQLVQFASVEQQINANANLSQLIDLTQGQQVLQSAQLVGRQVLLASDKIVLQDGAGAIRFQAASAQPVGIAVYSDAGVKLHESVVNASAGVNDWSWNGRAANGARLRDGAYRIAVMGAQADGSTAALPFSVRATATGVERGDSGVTLRLGAAGVPISTVRSLLDEDGK